MHITTLLLTTFPSRDCIISTHTRFVARKNTAIHCMDSNRCSWVRIRLTRDNITTRSMRRLAVTMLCGNDFADMLHCAARRCKILHIHKSKTFVYRSFYLSLFQCDVLSNLFIWTGIVWTSNLPLELWRINPSFINCTVMYCSSKLRRSISNLSWSCMVWFSGTDAIECQDVVAHMSEPIGGNFSRLNKSAMIVCNLWTVSFLSRCHSTRNSILFKNWCSQHAFILWFKMLRRWMSSLISCCNSATRFCIYVISESTYLINLKSWNMQRDIVAKVLMWHLASSI